MSVARVRSHTHANPAAISARAPSAANVQHVGNRRSLPVVQEDESSPNPPPSAWHKWAMMGGLIILGLLVIGLGVFMMTLHRKVSSIETERSATINEDDVRHIVQQGNQAMLQKVGQVMESFSKDMGERVSSEMQRLDARLSAQTPARAPAPAPAPAPVVAVDLPHATVVPAAVPAAAAPAAAAAPVSTVVDVATISGDSVDVDAGDDNGIVWTSTPLPNKGGATESPKEAEPPQHVQLDM